MKVSKEQAAAHRQEIVRTAAEKFRECGFDGVGIADIMQAAGLTHGGFYGHFGSKEELMAEACALAFAEKQAMWTETLGRSQGSRLATVAKRYFAPLHRRDAGGGCPLPALATETGRQPRSVRRAFTAGLRALVDVLTGDAGRGRPVERERALAAWSTLAGAMMLARAVDDRQLADEILTAAARSLENTRPR